MLSAIYFDPNPIAFQIPLIGVDIAWYGVFFAIGILCVHFFALQYIKVLALLKLQKNSLNRKNLSQKFRENATLVDRCLFFLLPNAIKEHLQQLYLQGNRQEAFRSAKSLADRVFFWGVLGGIIGARLAHVFFYDWPYYSQNLLEIFNTRAGGLASHGGAVGATLGILFLSCIQKRKNNDFSFLNMLDFSAVGMGVGACFIRIGNFINQEILGINSSLPWAVRFGHPADGRSFIARHPIQIYESVAYLFIFIFLFLFAIKNPKQTKGRLIGLFLILVFSFRFFIEFFKEEQAVNIKTSINMGSWLSLPMIIAGLLLIFKKSLPSRT